MILKLSISQFSNILIILQLISFSKFFVHFRINRSSRANEYFLGLADIILDLFWKQKWVLNILLK